MDVPTKHTGYTNMAIEVTNANDVIVPGILLQQALALQVPGNAVGDGVCQVAEFITGRSPALIHHWLR